jgi:ribosomal protein S6--L-glutamate ligase
LGQPSTDTKKNYIKILKKQVLVYVLDFWPAIKNCTATSASWKQAKCVVMKCTFEHQECYMKLDAKTPEIHYRGGKILNQFDAVIPKSDLVLLFYGCALTRQFEALKVYCLNSSNAITQSRDKLYSLH